MWSPAFACRCPAPGAVVPAGLPPVCGEAVPKPGVGSNGQAIKRHNSRDGFEYVTNPVRGRSMSADSAGSSSSRSPRRLASKDSTKGASGLTKKLSEDFLPVT